MRRFSVFLFGIMFLASAGAYAAASMQLLTPRSISVPGGESQDVSVRVLDAAGRPSAGEQVSFANDACGFFAGSPNPYVATLVSDANGVATVHFTASNPPGITCRIDISAGATTTVNVLTYRVSDVVMVVDAPASPPAGRPFTLRATPSWGAYSLKNVDVTARVVSGAVALSATTANTGEAGYAEFTVTPPFGATGYTIELAYRTRTKTYVAGDSGNVWQDMWWSSIENGWGVSLVQHRDQIFATMFVYDDAGKPTWFVVPGGTWDSSHTVFTGAAYVPKGTPFYAYDASKFVPGPAAGGVTITFVGPSQATFEYTLNGRRGYKELSRFEFAPQRDTPLSGLGDMWWGGQSQNGWGVAILQQYATLFVVIYTYDASGAPTWYVMPSGDWFDATTYVGHIYRTTSSPWIGKDYDPSKFANTDVGNFRLHFLGDNATFDYTLEGHAGSIPITRTPF